MVTFLELVGIVLLLWFAIYWDATLGMHFTFVEESKIYFVLKGEELHRVLLGIPHADSVKLRANLDKRGIKWSSKEKGSFLTRRFGIHFVGFLYPLVKLHRFTIVAEGVKEGTAGHELPTEKGALREWIYHEKREIAGLRWRFPRPVIVEGVELADRFTIDVLVMVLLEVEDPYLPVFVYGGDFFRIISSITQSAMNDMVVGKDEADRVKYSTFINIDKGEGSEFARELQKKINTGIEHGDTLPDAARGLTHVMGICAIKAYVEKFALSPEQEKIEAAVRAKEQERHEAEAKIEKAKGDAEARRLNIESEALRPASIVAGLVHHGVDPNAAAQLVRDMIKTENMKQWKGGTWVDGGGQAMVAVSDRDKGSDKKKKGVSEEEES